MRAGNLAELIYKQGQAGVNKASVTIVFDNSDPSKSPVGFETHRTITVTRQVLLGGKSKYLINGRNSSAGQVQNFFHSVQLNVNNPHFLIMQGRITKVLNMKATETLGMIEEAAGTRMYESKRLAALKTIDKKQAKLEDLNTVLSEEITPTLERLRGEKHSYLKWSKNNADMKRLEKFVVASQYLSCKKAIENTASSRFQQEKKEIECEISALREQMQCIEEENASKAGKIGKEFELIMSTAKKDEQQLSNLLVKQTSLWKNAQHDTKKASADVQATNRLISASNESIVAKVAALADQKGEVEKLRSCLEAAKEELSQASDEYQSMSAGKSNDCSLPDQIAKAQRDAKAARAKTEQSRMTISHLSKELEVTYRSADCPPYCFV